MATAEGLLEEGGAVEKFYGGRLLATTELYRGERDRVVRAIDEMVSRASTPPSMAEPARLFEAKLFLDTGEDSRALETALAMEDSEERYSAAPAAKVVAAIASRRLGDIEQSDRLVREYAAIAEDALGPAPQRMYQFLLGEVALVDGRPDEAISHLNEAESMLPPRGAEGIHALIWYSLATAHREAGNLGEATSWYERILGSSEERLFEPIPYVRSFYYLAKLHEAEGDLPAARGDYERFVSHWGEGSIDRDPVREAREKLAAPNR